MRAPISASRLQARGLPSLLHTCIWLLPASDSSSPSMTRSWRRQARGAAQIASRGACLRTWLSIYLGTRRGLPGGIPVHLGSTYLCYAGSLGSRVRRTTFGFWLSFLLPGSVAFLSCSLASVFITWEQRQYFPVSLFEEILDMNVFWRLGRA